jgi:hypothetical protein
MKLSSSSRTSEYRFINGFLVNMIMARDLPWAWAMVPINEMLLMVIRHIKLLMKKFIMSFIPLKQIVRACL